MINDNYYCCKCLLYYLYSLFLEMTENVYFPIIKVRGNYPKLNTFYGPKNFRTFGDLIFCIPKWDWTGDDL